MKPALQFGTREHAEQAAVVLAKDGIKFEIVSLDPGATHPEFIDPKVGGFLPSTNDEVRMTNSSFVFLAHSSFAR